MYCVVDPHVCPKRMEGGGSCGHCVENEIRTWGSLENEISFVGLLKNEIRTWDSIENEIVS